MSKITSEVFCSLQVDGTHNWPTCPFEEVKYLREIHRHMFHIKAHKIVSHDDRDTEFIRLKHQIKIYIATKYFKVDKALCEFGAMSCEMLARELIEEFQLCRCEVSEDNENGAILYVS